MFECRTAVMITLSIVVLAVGGCKPRGFIEKDACVEVDMPTKPAYAEYYDKDGKIIKYMYKGVETALVEDMNLTKENQLCQAEPQGGGGPCNPPKAGYCSRQADQSGFFVCVLCQ